MFNEGLSWPDASVKLAESLLMSQVVKIATITVVMAIGGTMCQ